MDWSRAKTILILAFLVLDLFLAGQLIQMMQQKQEYTQNTPVTQQEIDKQLKAHHLILTAAIPKAPDQIYPYQATVTTTLDGNWERDGKAFVKTFATPPSFKSRDELDNLLKAEVPFFNDYQYQPNHPDSGSKRIYLQYAGGHPIFDARLEVTVKPKNRIASIRVVHYSLKELSSPVNLAPVNNALYRFITSGELGKKSTITEMKLGYYAKYPNASDNFILIPYWRFRVKNDYFYVNATQRGLSEETIEKETIKTSEAE
jgi:regulatory protein YycI of two-component signal transduction system YycFG